MASDRSGAGGKFGVEKEGASSLLSVSQIRALYRNEPFSHIQRFLPRSPCSAKHPPLHLYDIHFNGISDFGIRIPAPILIQLVIFLSVLAQVK